MLQGCPGETGTQAVWNRGSGVQGHPGGSSCMSKLTTDGDSPAYRILLELSDSKSSRLLGRALFSPHKADFLT